MSSIYKKKRIWIPLSIIILLIIARLLLPHFVKKYVNQVLADIPGYYGQVGDIDIALIRGAYQIEDMYLKKSDATTDVPFLQIKNADISIAWSALFKGKIVSEIELLQPELIYVFEDQKKQEAPDPNAEDWTKALTDIVPIDINHLQVTQGKVAFVQIAAEPNIDLNLNNIALQVTNLRNVSRTSKDLPSTLEATAVSFGQGNVKVNGKLDILKEIPDMDVNFSLENAKATALNDLTNHYAGIDFNEGTFNLQSEIAISDGYLKGYLKPLLTDLDMVGRNDGFLDTLWEGFVGFFKFVLKNHKTDTLATKVPIEGDLNEVKSEVIPTILNIFKNAWITAFKNVSDDSIDFQEVEKINKNKED